MEQNNPDQDIEAVAAKRKRSGWQFSLVINTVFIVCGLGAVGFGAFQVSEAKQEAQWPTVEGTVSDSRLIGTSGRKTTFYEVNLDYSYKVADCSYTGKGALAHYSDGAAAGECIEKNRQGAKVKVYVNPSSPSRSLLKPSDTSAVGMVFIIMGGIFSLIGLFTLAIDWFRFR